MHQLYKYYGPRLALKDPFHTGLAGFITRMGMPATNNAWHTLAKNKVETTFISNKKHSAIKNKFIMKITNLKWALPIAFLTASLAFFAFKPAPSKVSETILYFKYQPTNDYSSISVESNTNWELVSSSLVCEQETDEVACSFSIRVPLDEKEQYVNSSNNPSSRVLIQANGSGSNYHVDDVTDNVSNTQILDSKENIERP